ncbi:MAG: phage integrase SAM-like domain-containing protein [Mucilaginibacter sp.]|jgi:integrase|uniref:phage integrase SAM-like domain-containing protein n=1 Tax=Mucilaginibacter sp. TaxID=1882438 RepID=UPI003566E7C4
MATLSAKVFKHHKKADGTYNVKIYIYHNSVRSYMDTEHYVTDKQLKKDLQIKDTFLLSILNRTLDDYRKTISDLGPRLDLLDAHSLKDYLQKKEDGINFLGFCQIHIDQLKANGQVKSAANYNTLRNHLVDFFESDRFQISDISVPVIKAFVRFLSSKRKVIRTNQFGRPYEFEAKGAAASSISNYLRDFSGFFTAAIHYYNKPALGYTPISYNPFLELRSVDRPETKKRNIDVEQIIKIRDCRPEESSRAELARDMFMLSFYLCGINAVDIYQGSYTINDGRLEYNRSKTKGKRKDHAFISINIPAEAMPLILKYNGKLSKRYATITNFNKALSKGMKVICGLTGLSEVTFYWARHSFGNLARNKCRKSKDDVALALNHVDQGRKTTDIYLEKDWSIVDEVQAAVINLLRIQAFPVKDERIGIRITIFKDIRLPQLV